MIIIFYSLCLKNQFLIYHYCLLFINHCCWNFKFIKFQPLIDMLCYVINSIITCYSLNSDIYCLYSLYNLDAFYPFPAQASLLRRWHHKDWHIRSLLHAIPLWQYRCTNVSVEFGRGDLYAPFNKFWVLDEELLDSFYCSTVRPQALQAAAHRRSLLIMTKRW